MKKIPTIFKRNPENMRELLNIPNEDCLWVFNGEGKATRKYDGTAVKIENGKYYKRREIKKDAKIPVDFIEEQFDENTGKLFGWVPINPELKEDKWHMEAFDNSLSDGTYELIGPKIQGNPEKCNSHILVKHSNAYVLENVPRTFNGICEYLLNIDIEGIVFHHPDGRMAKIKKRDYGLKRRIE